ncbi:MAG: ATP-binding protein [Brevundimonas sp.]|nr:ATP-binding protein [Brevundimonas sp.]
MQEVFIGFPEHPADVVDSINAGIGLYRAGRASKKIVPWTDLDGFSVHIIDSIREAISRCSHAMFDITTLNANVCYEIGYAAGLGKPLSLLLNSSVKDALLVQSQFGIFDTQRLKLYRNGGDVSKLIDQTQDPYYQAPPPVALIHEAPVYFQDFAAKTEFAMAYATSVAGAGFHSRTHDPEEEVRLPLHRAHREVASSAGVFLSLIPHHIIDSDHHNLRAYLLAGLADGLGIPRLMIGYGDIIPPFDLRDDIVAISDLNELESKVEDFKPAILEALQKYRAPKRTFSSSYLTQLSLGASVAENEFRRLDSYFLETREYFRALRGEAQLVVGRKGTGKTAIFWQLKERLQSDRAHVVLDLRPDGFHLRKLNELVSVHFSEATHSHTMTAFWEYVLLLELAHRLLEEDEFLLGRDARIVAPYERLQAAYKDWDEAREGDFPERLLRLIKRLRTDLGVHMQDGEKHILTTPQITEIVFKHDIRELRQATFSYLELKKRSYILVDNLDKGWNASGVTSSDTMLVQSLIDAGRKIQRDALRKDNQINVCLFLRDDVYEFLVRDASDRGKENPIRIVWNDPSSLLKMINMRLAVSSAELGVDPPLQWENIATPFIAGTSSFEYLVRHAMHRPRALIDIIDLALSYAAQSGHTAIASEDVMKATASYSTELLQNFNFEVADVFPSGDRVVYKFVGPDSTIDAEAAASVIADHIGPDADVQGLFDVLLWFGFFGVLDRHNKPVYIFDVGESLDLLKAQSPKNNQRVVIHPMFRLALQK